MAETAFALAPMTLDDLDEVMVIERASFQTPWSQGAFRYELTQNRVAHCTVIRVGNRRILSAGWGGSESSPAVGSSA